MRCAGVGADLFTLSSQPLSRGLGKAVIARFETFPRLPRRFASRIDGAFRGDEALFDTATVADSHQQLTPALGRRGPSSWLRAAGGGRRPGR